MSFKTSIMKHEFFFLPNARTKSKKMFTDINFSKRVNILF